MFTIKRLNHAVLYVRDAKRALEFYRGTLGFEVVEAMGDRAYFLRANGSDNHHDLGLFGIGEQAEDIALFDPDRFVDAMFAEAVM